MAGMSNAAFARLLATINSDPWMEVGVGSTVALVDPDDYDLVSNRAWQLTHGYAVIKIGGKTVSMHRLIMGAVEGQFVDHIDGNRLNNQRLNLRFCTKRQNSQNRHSVGGVIPFKGVRRDENSWRATIKKDGKPINLGVFATARLAAKAYDRAAKKYFGEFAKTNADLNLY